ncbi:hypothetical protein [Hymenobacter jeollabukensis]|uniref:Uncharacterized protein n=1 Tax=Hymenobacter jeollabukensis TaxID=2025313 RepID=A0A5R8WIW1_9BACT|nr:hypothetical protein [Hymenobacter jeollabukensis]TLM88715.1 hypothetical protein FDY95_23045 [Hymenobacter jeollabukensis]
MPNYTNLIDCIQIRVGQAYPFENVLPGEERGAIDAYMFDLFHIAYYARKAGPLVIDAFRNAPIYYGFCEPIPGAPFFVFDIGGDNQWAVDFGLDYNHLLEAVGKDGVKTWHAQVELLQQRPSETFLLPLTLVCADTNQVLAVRHIQAPVALALEARYLLERQERLAGPLATQLLQALQLKYEAEDLLNEAGALHCQPAPPRGGSNSGRSVVMA